MLAAGCSARPGATDISAEEECDCLTTSFEGRRAVDFTLSSVDGETVHLAERVESKPVILAFGMRA
jgi:hypothetical protein